MKFKLLAEHLELLNNTKSRLEKTKIISDLLKQTKPEEYESVLLLLEGRVFPTWSNKKLGLAGKIAIKAISKAFGVTIEDIEKHFKSNGDLGLSAEFFSKNKKQQTLFNAEEISVEKVYNNFKKLAEAEGSGTVDIKLGLIAELLNNANNIEAKYIIRIAIGDLRIGVAFGTIRDALAITLFPEIEKEENKGIKKETISLMQTAFDRLNESFKIAIIAKNQGLEGLKKVNIEVMTPIKVMLMQKVKDVREAIEKINLPFGMEYKYDGFRVIGHKKDNKIKLFTRNLEDVTEQFPDIVEQFKEKVLAKEAILDGEVLGVDSEGKFLSFQHISQRIKRKHNIDELVKKIPVVYATWDILFFDGESLIEKKQSERRKILIEKIKQDESFLVSKQKIIYNEDEGEDFYKESLSAGNEGVVIKDLNAKYKPGNRVGCWLKLKPIMDPLSLVIVEAEWGEGKRTNWLTSFTIACKDNEGNFLTIGKVGTGIKEIEQNVEISEESSIKLKEKKENYSDKSNKDNTTFSELTDLLKPLILSENGKSIKVEPKIIIEVAYEEIQKSPTYTSGFALRFPRFLRLRETLHLEDVESIETIKKYFYEQ